MCHRTILAGIASLLLVTTPAATMTISMSTGPPITTDVIVAVDVEEDFGCYLCSHGTAAVVDIGQTFRLPAPSSLGRVTIKVRALTEQTPGELVTLIVGTYTDPGDDSMDQVLVAETEALPLTLPVGEVRYLTFDMVDLFLAADQQYGFQLAFTGGTHVKEARLELLHVGSDAFPLGLAVETVGTITAPLPYDLVFYLHRGPLVFADSFESGDLGPWTVIR